MAQIRHGNQSGDAEGMPFDIHAFTGYCKVTSTFFNTYMENTTLRLITSEIVEGEENTIVLHGLYFDGYDTKLKIQQRGYT